MTGHAHALGELLHMCQQFHMFYMHGLMLLRLLFSIPPLKAWRLLLSGSCFCACLVPLIPFCVLRCHLLSESLSPRRNRPESGACWWKEHVRQVIMHIDVSEFASRRCSKGFVSTRVRDQTGSKTPQQSDGRLPHLCLERRHGIFELIRPAATQCGLSQNRQSQPGGALGAFHSRKVARGE